MKKFISWMLLAASVAAFAADATRSSRVDFTSQPEGASVIVDGSTRGVTPLTLFDLKSGASHHVRFELKNHDPEDQFFNLSEGAYLTQNAVLAPIRGLVLVTTEPAGCNISLDGRSLGETPRLLTKLEAGITYRLLLQKPGFQPRTLEVKPVGRTPLVKHEVLILDSGIVQITTDPTDAEVIVNGITRGKTPLTVRDIPKGRATVTLRRPGYKDESRELSLSAGDSQNLFVKMEGIPGSIAVSSVPEGARFYLNGEFRGKGAMKIANLAPGTYKVRAEMDNFGTVEREVTVGFGAAVSEEFRLESTLGWLEVRTIPVGAVVLVDGRTCGTTKSEDPKAKASDVLRVDGIAEGEHTVTVRAKGYAEATKHVTTESSKSTQVNVQLKRVFIPDIEIETDTGIHTGVLINNGAEYVTIEVSMGVERTFPRAEIRKFTFLGTPGILK